MTGEELVVRSTATPVRSEELGVRSNTSHLTPHSSLAAGAAARRAWTGALLLLLMTALLTWGVLAVRDPATLPLKAVKIEGSFTHVTTAELQHTLAGALNGGFLNVDVAALRTAAKRLPWVRDVNVRRVWPDTLRVLVTEHVPVARWADAALLNADGEVFTPGGELPAQLPQLRGPRGTAGAVLVQYRTMNAALAPLDLRITQLELDERRAWRALLDNGTELLLGHTEAYARLLRFVQVYDGLLDAQRTRLAAGGPSEAVTPGGAAPAAADPAPSLARVDLRYGNGLAVRWKTSTQQQNISTQRRED